ncbi:MAG: HEAT repeat domain-containing protein [Stigonema ocellatum SAG 48.90 = DSM 106950]|nr:HEAT repeat domain-containing protein [Stigonema ocellatum SAG 48.90 = DSM 106950]
MDKLQTALAQLRNSSPDIRESALDKIGNLKPDNAFEIILPFLSDSNPEIRGAAACNLGEIDDSRSVAHLIDLAKNDPEEKVRSEALSALDNFRTPEILICLINEVHRVKKSRRPRQIVAQQLQYYDDERSVDALSFLLLEDEDVYVRIFAVDSLLALNRSRLLNVWQKALDDESTYVIEVANKAIENLQNSEELLEAG